MVYYGRNKETREYYTWAYYRNYILWKTFFEGLGCTLILSPVTNKDIIETGKNLSVDESCLPSKIYLGHIKYLSGKCDYILVPRVCNYGKENRLCMKFHVIYDVVHNLFPDINILDYNIDNLKFRYEFFGFIKIGFKINKNIFKIIYFYIQGKVKEKKHNLSLIRNQVNVIKSNKLKVLIVAHPYVIYDDYLGTTITKYFKDNNIDILYSDRMDRKESISYAEEFSSTLYFLYSKEIIGSAFYYKDAVDGIIFLSSFPCGPDSLVNELAIRKLDGVPAINITVDESTATSGLITRLESFTDIIKARRDNV